ncbi:MAG: hypothetical protein U0271_15025 [Polyangiaceae bacterium]
MPSKFVRLIFEYGFSDQDAVEVTQRGYRSHVWVELSDGSKHAVTFFDPQRLAQELLSEAQAGRPFVAEPGLIVLREVTRESMENAAKVLANEGFFEPRSAPP